jgi:hypothetical protein
MPLRNVSAATFCELFSSTLVPAVLVTVPPFW